MVFWAADARARRREVVKGAMEIAKAKIVDMDSVGRASGSGSGEIFEGLQRQERQWEDDEILQTRNYIGTREDIVAYCHSFDLDVPVGSTDPLPRSSSGFLTRTGSDSVE